MKEANTPWNVLILVYLLNRVYVLSNGPILMTYYMTITWANNDSVTENVLYDTMLHMLFLNVANPFHLHEYYLL